MQPTTSRKQRTKCVPACRASVDHDATSVMDHTYWAGSQDWKWGWVCKKREYVKILQSAALPAVLSLTLAWWPHLMNIPGEWSMGWLPDPLSIADPPTSRLFHRLKIGRFSGSLAELFLAPPIAALSEESRSVPAVVSTIRLLLIFNLWAAECTRCFLYFKWVFPVVNILMLWCMFAVFQCCFVLYVLCVYCAHFHSLHERPSCQNGILSLHPLWVFLWELGLILNECFL